MKIVAIVGSLRKESYNLKLAEIVKSLIDIDFEIVTVHDIPMINEDIEHPAPIAVTALRQKVVDAELLWLFTPEYNHSYSGVMKNTIDWLSRANDEGIRILNKKKIALSGVSPSPNGTKNAQDKLISLLEFLRADIMKDKILTYADAKLPNHDDEDLLDMIERVKEFIKK